MGFPLWVNLKIFLLIGWLSVITFIDVIDMFGANSIILFYN